MLADVSVHTASCDAAISVSIWGRNPAQKTNGLFRGKPDRDAAEAMANSFKRHGLRAF